MRQAIPGWTLLACGALLVSCGSNPASTSGTTSVRDALYFSTTSVPVGYVGESYEAPLTVAGGAGPYSLRVAAGTLPPGLTLRNLQLTGTPSKTGTYTFTLEASDANLSTRVQQYTLNVNELPPLALKPQLPTGELRGETRIPLSITAPRTVRAARVVWDLPEGVTVTRVQTAEAGGVLFWKQSGRTLTLDVGFKNVPRSGARVALVGLKPQKVVTLDTARFAYEARDGTGKVLAEVKMPEAPKPAPPASSGTPTPATSSTPAGAPNIRPPAGDTTSPGSGGQP
ncbi:Ig domain-containing protein [Deinococcus sp. YIM 77859]|uniref:Ig domain-containing protein n=1 Tax=Deinococcus sp. YIM 77859 TaxID=1540221 RepID=UPI00068CDD5B|nr:Ig domain-containing protein [Deinococcus sp. YIM 77859]